MASYILRSIDPELWTAVKARAAKEGHPLRWLLLALLRAYVSHGIGYVREGTDRNVPTRAE